MRESPHDASPRGVREAGQRRWRREGQGERAHARGHLGRVMIYLFDGLAVRASRSARMWEEPMCACAVCVARADVCVLVSNGGVLERGKPTARRVGRESDDECESASDERDGHLFAVL